MIKWIAILLSIFTVNITQSNDVTLSVCQNDNGSYQFSYTGDVDGWWFNDFISADLDTLTATGDGVEFVVYYDGTTESIFGDPDAPDCHQQDDTWQPGAPSIPVPLNSDCAFIEIQDIYGHWSQVQSNGQDVLLHYGEALIGSSGQSTDPTDYRAVETGCF